MRPGEASAFLLRRPPIFSFTAFAFVCSMRRPTHSTSSSGVVFANEAGDVDRHPVALASAEQVADRFAGGFAEKVEDGCLGPCDRRPECRPGVLVVRLVDIDLIDHRFKVAGVAAGEEWQDPLFQHRSEEMTPLVDHDETLGTVPGPRAKEMEISPAHEVDTLDDHGRAGYVVKVEEGAVVVWSVSAWSWSLLCCEPAG